MSVNDSPIEWTDATWGPVRGCSRVSPGCENCYAERQANRFKAKGLPYEGLVRLSKKGPAWTGVVRLIADQLDAPLRWKKPRRIFVNSMSDLFHEKLTNEEIAAVFGAMACCSRHTFQILTKRAKRMREWFAWIEDQGLEVMQREFWQHTGRAGMVPWKWPLPNVWLGVSIENQQYANERMLDLLLTPAATRFVSYEPALGPVDFTAIDDMDTQTRWNALESTNDWRKLDWVIVGGESGPGARPFDIEWARSTIAQCRRARVACFVKQFGRRVRRVIPGSAFSDDAVATVIEASMKHKKGADMSEWPEDLRVREWP